MSIPYKMLSVARITSGLAAAAISCSVFSQVPDDIQSPPDGSAYLQDARGVIVRSGTGMCWRGGSWDSSKALTGCDGVLAPPVQKAIAPTVVTVTEAAPAANTTARCDFSFVLGGDASFRSGQANLSAAAKRRLDQDFAAQMANCKAVSKLTITGHADSTGSTRINQALSAKRAAAVASYLSARQLIASSDTIGAGSRQPVRDCSATLAKRERAQCHAENRRVVIAVEGLQK